MTQVVEGLSEEGPAPDNEADDANRRKTMARPREPQPDDDRRNGTESDAPGEVDVNVFAPRGHVIS